jgi:integrase
MHFICKQDAGEGYGLLILVLAYTGLRWGELAGLRVRYLDFVRGPLDVHTTMVEVDGYMEESRSKDYEEQYVPISTLILERLSLQLEVRHCAEKP